MKKVGSKILGYLLVLLILIYIAGFLGQILDSLGKHPIDEEIPGITANPLYCISYAFFVNRGVTLILMGIVVVVMLLRRFDRFSGSPGDKKRKFSASDKGIYGTSGWMEKQEMKETLEISRTAKEAKGFILGSKEKKVISQIPNKRVNGHIAVCGTTGAGKSSCFSINYALKAAERGESIFISDVKGEMYSALAEEFIRKGYCVRRFNLVSPQNSDSWQLLAEVQGDPQKAQILCDMIFANTTDSEKDDPFWRKAEYNLLLAMVLLVNTHARFSEHEKSMPTVYDLILCAKERWLSQIFYELNDDNPAKKAYQIFQDVEDKIKGNIIIGLSTRLQVFQLPEIREITSHDEIDLCLPAKQKCCYFILLSDQHIAFHFLATLFFRFAFWRLCDYADEQKDKKCDIPVHFLLEELPALNLDDLPKKIGVLRSRSIFVVCCFQTISQLQKKYPYEWNTILGCCDTQLFMGCNDMETAEITSQKSGQISVEVESESVLRRTFSPVQVIPQYRKTQSISKRMLLTPDEVLRMNLNEVIVFLRGHKPLILNKFHYTEYLGKKQLEFADMKKYVPLWVYEKEKAKKQSEIRTNDNGEVQESPLDDQHILKTVDVKDYLKNF